jgi:hypothetical protein
MTTTLWRVGSTCVLIFALLAGSVELGGAAWAQEIVVAPTKPTGVYDVGEPVEWRVEYKGPAAPPQLAYVLKKHNLTVAKEGTIPLADGVGTLKASLDEPGTLLVEFRVPTADAAGGTQPATGGKPVRGLGGAAVAPARIKPSAPPPADFDAFWAAKLAELAAVPANPQVEPVDAGQVAGSGQPADAKRPPVDYYKVRLDNVRGTHVYGQLAKPKPSGKYPTGKFPALLVVQYAGVYGLPKSNVVARAERGWLCLNVMAHDLPFDQPEAFYKEQAAGPLKDYVRIGNEDRDTSYFLRMYLGCYRAADYLASRDDWDGKTLVVMGTSQGGMQSILTAAVHPKVTAMIANVPGGCDFTGSQVGRANGWPNWAGQAWGPRREEGRRGQPVLRPGELRPAYQVPRAGVGRADRRDVYPAGHLRRVQPDEG